MIELLAFFGFICTIGAVAVGFFYLGGALYHHLPHTVQAVMQLLVVVAIVWWLIWSCHFVATWTGNENIYNW